MGFGAWALAEGAAPWLPLHDNHLEIIALGIAGLAIAMLPISLLLKWNWETKYFGAGLLSLASGSIINIYPILCIALYSSLPKSICCALVLLNVILTTNWCYRFVNFYRSIYYDKDLFDYIYNEEASAVYYLQQADNQVIDKIFKFNQFPSSRFFISSFAIAFALTPFATLLSRFIGVPFTHIFLAIAATPLSLMFLGLSTKMWLVYYFYPIKIRKKTNKPVYVDMSSQPSKPLSDVKTFLKFPNQLDIQN